MQTQNTAKIDQTQILIVEDDPVLARMYAEKFKFESEYRGEKIIIVKSWLEIIDDIDCKR